MTDHRHELAEKWLKENDWDYSKYGDRRSDRSAYDGRMNYEISSLLSWAFEEGYAASESLRDRSQQASDARAKRLVEALENSANVLELAEMGFEFAHNIGWPQAENWVKQMQHHANAARQALAGWEAAK